jgi:hypothetical protein
VYRFGGVYLDHVDDDLVSVLVLGQLDGHSLRLPRPHLAHLNKQCFSCGSGLNWPVNPEPEYGFRQEKRTKGHMVLEELNFLS